MMTTDGDEKTVTEPLFKILEDYSDFGILGIFKEDQQHLLAHPPSPSGSSDDKPDDGLEDAGTVPLSDTDAVRHGRRGKSKQPREGQVPTPPRAKRKKSNVEASNSKAHDEEEGFSDGEDMSSRFTPGQGHHHENKKNKAAGKKFGVKKATDLVAEFISEDEKAKKSKRGRPRSK